MLPLLKGWFDGEAVLCVSADVSRADMASAKGANFAPRLAQALPAGPPQPERRSSVDKVYAVTNLEQPSIFASAPAPVGPGAEPPGCWWHTDWSIARPERRKGIRSIG